MHRGPLSAVRQYLEEKSLKMKKVESSPLQKPVCKNMATARSVFEKDNNETNEQRNKQLKLIKTVDDKEENVECETITQNGNNTESVVSPPKPLPRRTNSLSEGEEAAVPKPVARPRTNSVIPTTAALSVAAAPPPLATHTPTTYKVNIVKHSGLALHLCKFLF